MSKDCNVVGSFLETFCNSLFSRGSSKRTSEPDIQQINSFPSTTGDEIFKSEIEACILRPATKGPNRNIGEKLCGPRTLTR